MEINTSDLSSTINATAIKATKTSTPPSTPATTENSNASTLQGTNTDTVSFSAAAIALSTSTDNESTINTEEDAQAAVQQFQQDAANDPTLTQEAQSTNLTSDVVSQLIG